MDQKWSTGQCLSKIPFNNKLICFLSYPCRCNIHTHNVCTQMPMTSRFFSCCTRSSSWISTKFFNDTATATSEASRSNFVSTIWTILLISFLTDRVSPQLWHFFLTLLLPPCMLNVHIIPFWSTKRNRIAYYPSPFRH